MWPLTRSWPLVLAHAVAPIFSIPQVCAWWLSTLLLVGLLFVTALNAWWETMKMIKFQSYRQQTKDVTRQAAHSPS